MSKLNKTIDLMRTEGPAIALRYAASYLGFLLLGGRLPTIEDICYQRWRRRHVPSAEDLETMRSEAGHHFDPEMIEAFFFSLDVIQNIKESIPEEIDN